MIPFAQISEAADRRWTFRLLDRLVAPELPADERKQIVQALAVVSDPRAVPVLERLMTDCSQPSPTRESAGEVLRRMQYLDIEWPEATLRQWWHSDDAIVRRHALLSMDRGACPDIVRAVATDLAHPYRAIALKRMMFYFDSPADFRLKLTALDSPDPAVREAVADLLFWDEPVCAEVPLIAATADPVAEVATVAAATLQYFPTTRVIRCLHGLLGHPEARVREAAHESLADIRNQCQIGIWDGDPQVASRIRHWLEPVWNLLAFTPEELSPPAGDPHSTSPAPQTHPPIVTEMLGLLADPDTSPKVLEEHLWASGWDQYSLSDRGRLRSVLLNHADPFVRERGTVPLQEWGDVDGLLALARDPDFGVRKSAFYRLGLLPAELRIAALAWDHLQRPDVFGVHASETLSTFAAHEDARVAIPQLASLAADHDRPENLRVVAVHKLVRLKAGDAVRELVGILEEPPAVTWALQIAILDAMADLGLPALDVRHLAKVDQLNVQAALGRIGVTD